MRYSDIKTGCIYNIIFDPVRDCEFNGKHLAVVLKKNDDARTSIVMPLTSAANGVGVNKYYIGQLNCLPSSLRNNNTYAVFNQIRTVNASRFIVLKEHSRAIECRLDKDVFYKLLELAMKEIIYNIPSDDKIDLLKRIYDDEKIMKAKDMAYTIRNGKSNISEENKREKMTEIRQLIEGVDYQLDEKLISDGIDLIFNEAKM